MELRVGRPRGRPRSVGHGQRIDRLQEDRRSLLRGDDDGDRAVRRADDHGTDRVSPRGEDGLAVHHRQPRLLVPADCAGRRRSRRLLQPLLRGVAVRVQGQDRAHQERAAPDVAAAVSQLGHRVGGRRPVHELRQRVVREGRDRDAVALRVRNYGAGLKAPRHIFKYARTAG